MKLKEALQEFFAWLRKQPLVGPLLNILNSRKGAIAVWLTILILKALPDLEKVHGELNVVVGALVTIVVIWLTTSLGYAYEDAAAKSGGSAVIVPAVPTGNADGKTVVSTATISTTTTPANVDNEPRG